MSGKVRLEQLYHGFLNNQLSEDELANFLERLHDMKDEERVAYMMDKTMEEMELLLEVKHGKSPIVRLWSNRFLKMVVAVAVVLVLGTTAYFLLGKRTTRPGVATTAPIEQRYKNDVQPGTKVPELVLADGRRVSLDSALSGELATEGTVRVTRTANGEIVYKAPARTVDIKFNTINNPRGSKVVSLFLADGSKVWLDAGSSIKYPTAFTGKERRVEINGQAYFEVTHSSTPFIVSTLADPPSSNGQAPVEIRVLGTHFNVLSFEDDPIKVTLLEGSVRVVSAGNAALIKPGEQALVTNPQTPAVHGIPGIPVRVVQDPDLEQTMAWKNGIFKFNETTIEDLMKQLARWYDLEVVYEERPSEHFVSTIPRDASAIEVFKILEATGQVHFRIEGKKVIVGR